MLAEIGKMRIAERDRREDRATVSEFFNGAPPISDAEAEEIGLTVNVNNLFGYRELADAKDQMFGLFTKPARLIEVEIDVAPPGKRADWSMYAQEQASRVLRKITSFKSAYEGACGDATLHGEAVFLFGNKTFPLPRQAPLSKVLVPNSASTDTTQLQYFGIEDEITLHDLSKYYRKNARYWKGENLRLVLKDAYKDSLAGQELDTMNVEDMEYRRQENSASTTSRNLSVQVYRFFQKRCDKQGDPWDQTILLKHQGDLADGDERLPNAILFEKECFYDSVHQLIQPFFMDCILGGEPKWHRVLGLGHLNYQLNVAIELLICRSMQATVEGSMNMWKAKDSATREQVQQILLRHNGVVPENVELIQQRYQPNFAGMLEMVQFFRQQGGKNARGVTPNNGSQNDQLEVQAMFEQNVAASSMNARSSNWYDYQDRLLAESWRRLTDPFIDPCDPGYSEIKDFQAAMERKAIDLFWLQPNNVQVRAVRLVGDGLRSKELAAASFLERRKSQYAPEVQPKVERIITGLALDNYTLAEELTPVQEEPDSPQQLRADTENSIMITQRKPLPPKADDVDELHIMGHFPALERLIADALQYQKAAFTPPQAEAFQLIGGHIVAHIQRIEAKAQNNRNDPAREASRAYMEQLNQFAAMGEKLLHNMQQTQAGQQEEIDPVEMAKLDLQAQALALQNRKLEHSAQKFDRTQNFREQNTAFQQMMAMEKSHHEQQRDARDGALKDAEVASKIRKNAQPKTTAE